MSISDVTVSVLEHLRCVACQLNINKDENGVDMTGMSEEDLASIIHHHYQDHKTEDLNRQVAEKRKNEAECRNMKKLRVKYQKVFDLSDLEKLPNEIYEKILNYGEEDDLKNLRLASEWLYEKTTLMSDIFHDWYLTVAKGSPPDFILMSDRKFYINVDCKLDQEKVDKMGNFINRYGNRISSLEVHGQNRFFYRHLKAMKPAEFPYLTSLYFHDCKLDNDSLILLAPQLNNLSLFSVKSLMDLSSVCESDECFSKLKRLESAGCNIDIKKILAKCFTNLKYLYLGSEESCQFDDFNLELSSLSHIDIALTSDSEQSVSNLLSRASKRLKTLCLYAMDDNDIDLSNTLQQTMSISSLELTSHDAKNIHKFLSKCPLIRNLTLNSYLEDVGEVVIKDLLNLTLEHCDFEFISSFLSKVSKSSLRALHINNVCGCGELENCEFSVIQSLDTVRIDSANPEFRTLAQVSKLFPENTKIDLEVLNEYSTVFREVYESL